MTKVYFDGACRSNPGGAIGYGAIIILSTGETILLHHGEGPKAGNTNNVAEYKGLILALEKAKELGMEREEITVYGDSNLVCFQMQNIWKIDKGYYKEEALKAKRLSKRFSQIKFVWVPREENFEADMLSKIYV
jgi:ribonuclease HI